MHTYIIFPSKHLHFLLQIDHTMEQDPEYLNLVLSNTVSGFFPESSVVSRVQICLWNNRWFTRNPGRCQVLLSVPACTVLLIVRLTRVGGIQFASLSILCEQVLVLAHYSQFCFSCPVPVARAVLVDMEPKVISQTLSMAARSGYWKYDDRSHFCQKQGSGNNWANGYEQLFQASLRELQRLMSCLDSRSGTIAAVRGTEYVTLTWFIFKLKQQYIQQ